MADPEYDPEKRRERYLRERELKGRKPRKSASTTALHPKAFRGRDPKAEARDRQIRLTKKLKRLRSAKKEAQDALRDARKREKEQRDNTRNTEKKNSDGKTTAKERRAAKEYRDRNTGKIAAKRRKESSSTSQEKKSASDMSVDELKDRIEKIDKLITKAREQLRKASSLSHSITVDENNLIRNGQFDR